jgi:hypothetical protein
MLAPERASVSALFPDGDDADKSILDRATALARPALP